MGNDGMGINRTGVVGSKPHFAEVLRRKPMFDFSTFVY
jgi:hypothetical protein